MGRQSLDPQSDGPSVSDDGKRIRLQDLPNLTKNPGAGNGFGAWPAYRVSNGQMWSMQLRLNDCYRQQRFPYPTFGSDALTAEDVAKLGGVFRVTDGLAKASYYQHLKPLPPLVERFCCVCG